jgi:hypothetical protein
LKNSAKHRESYKRLFSIFKGTFLHVSPRSCPTRAFKKLRFPFLESSELLALAKAVHPRKIASPGFRPYEFGDRRPEVTVAIVANIQTSLEQKNPQINSRHFSVHAVVNEPHYNQNFKKNN